MTKRTLLILASMALAACRGGAPADEDEMTSDGGLRADGGARRDAGLPTSEPCSSPGALETVSCGACGSARRFCASSGVWEYGPCDGESGVCAPGESRDGTCGACGTQREVCTEACAWEAIGECRGGGTCEPGTLIRSREGCPRGQRDLRCSSACEYEPASECSVDACDTPGATEDVPCGMCGARTRFCTASGEWEYGPCGGEGVCVPGTTDEGTCAFCGLQAFRCTDRCEWVGFGECVDAGECAPGTSTRRSTGCPESQTRLHTCTASCRYEPSGSCEGGAGGGGLGEACVAGACSTGLVCSSETGIAICRRPCEADANCVTNAYCLGSGDRRECSDVCTLFSHAGCPTGAKCDYLGAADETGLMPITICSGVGTGRQGATCSRNSQCARDHSCVIASGTTGTCQQICDTSHPCPSGLTCSGSSIFPFPGLGLGAGFCR